MLTRLVPLVALSLLPLAVQAQNPTLGIWAGASVEKRIGKAVFVEVNSQVRISDNFTVARSYLGELGIGYRLSKHWKVAGFYRYTGRRRYDKETGDYYYRPYHRFYGELSFDHKIGRGLKADYRIRYQNQFKDDAEGLTTDKSYIRNKLELSYDFKTRVTPFASADVFYRIGTGIDQVRSKIGVDVSITKRHNLTLSVFTDVPVNAGPISEIYGNVAYKIKLK